jgi:hypothetical protein
MDSYNEMLVLNESDFNCNLNHLYNDNGTLELALLQLTHFKITSEQTYKPSVIMYRSNSTPDYKVFKNRWGKND